MVQYLRVILEQFYSLNDQVIKVQGIIFAQLLLVFFIDLPCLLFPEIRSCI